MRGTTDNRTRKQRPTTISGCDHLEVTDLEWDHSTTSKYRSHTPGASSPPLIGPQFEATLPNGTTVRVYYADITKLHVDAIVNAANGELDHIGGVAYAISEAAGPKFQKRSYQYVLRNGEVPESHVAVMKGYNLPAKNVIHAVGPIWRGWGQRETAKYMLEKTYLNAFQCASEELHAHSLAAPAISSGIKQLVFLFK